MRSQWISVTVIFLLAAGAAVAGDPPDNPANDIAGFLKVANEAASYRASHRLNEAEFIRMSGEPGTIVLDARSAARYAELHVAGAINLSFSDITVDSLRQTIPDKATRILIYCNNNFRNAEGPFPSKLPTASLNLSTFIALYNYGYRNVYELGPLLDIHSSRLTFEPPMNRNDAIKTGSEASRTQAGTP